MTHYNLMDPAELAELGWFSNDPLTHVLGASLRDHIEELEVTTEAMHDARAEARAYRYQVIPALHTQIAQLTATLNEKA